ncbi:FUSC family protein [Streptomyces sp. RB17]|uniref:FUSC family protein n=1 Tax=Streptomyces sp. RB17 TaxID=2585197 RepID=UPI0018867BC9|nr:FUSC family protein [Streptomyces sp. RB17]
MASDPGLIRLLSALGTVCTVLLTLGVLAALHAPVPILVTGALTAMVSTVAVTEPRPRDQALTLAAGVPVTLVIIVVGSTLTPYRVVADVVFVLLIFAAIYIRWLGPRATTLGVFAFQLFFVTQFVDTHVEQLPQLSLAVIVAFGSSALVRFVVLRSPPERTTARLQRAFRLRLALVLDALIEVAEGGPEAPQAERAVRELRRRAAHLHAAALLIEKRLGTGARAPRTGATVQRFAADAETALERLAITVLRFLWPDADIDTLTRHRAKGRLVGSAVDARDAVALPGLVSELRALRVALGPARLLPSGTDGEEVRNRLLGSRNDECPPDVSAAMRDALRSAVEFARAMSGANPAVVGRTSTSPERASEKPSREVSGRAADVVPGQMGTRVRPTTRTALQVATGSALAIVGGELLAPQRWYWAVFTCWVVYIGTASTGDVLVRGYRRLIGTIVGVVAGFALAALVGEHPWAAFALAVLSVFGMYYMTAVSYTLLSLFVTTMIGMLYTLLHALTPDVLVVRIEETALGIVCGLAAAVLILPVGTRERTDRLLRDVLERLRLVLTQALARLGGEPDGDLLGAARALDSALDDLRVSLQPLIIPVSPLRSRRSTALAVLGLLETAAFHTRGLAVAAERVPSDVGIGADPDVADEVRRIGSNLAGLIRPVADGGEDGTPLEPGSRIATRLALSDNSAQAAGVIATRQVLRHLHRLDASIQGLARTLGMPAPDDRDAGTAEAPRGSELRQGCG